MCFALADCREGAEESITSVDVPDYQVEVLVDGNEATPEEQDGVFGGLMFSPLLFILCHTYTRILSKSCANTQAKVPRKKHKAWFRMNDQFFSELEDPAVGDDTIVVKVCDARNETAFTSLNQLIFQAIGAETAVITATVNGQARSKQVRASSCCLPKNRKAVIMLE